MKSYNAIKALLKKTALYRRHLRKRNEIRNSQIQYLKHYFAEESVDMLRSFSEALNKAGIKFWLEFGTLLGYYREHGFIAHDLDIDTGTYYENATAVRAALENAGFKLVREYKVLDDGGMEHCFLFRHITIDVFFFRKDGNVMFCNSFYNILKADLSKKRYANKRIRMGVKRIEVPVMDYVPAKFYDCDVYVPADTDRYLRVHYGDSYMIPNPRYDNKKDSTNIIWFEYKEKPGEALLKLPYFGRPEDYGMID